MEPVFLTVKEVAGALRVSPLTVHRMIQKGKLTAVRPGRSYRIHASSYQAWLASQTEEVA